MPDERTPANPPRTAADFPPEVLRLFDAFVHGVIDRRAFLDRAAAFATVGATAAELLDALSPRFGLAQKVRPTDARLNTQSVDFPSPRGSGTSRGYLVRPKDEGKRPGVLVIHENRGLNPHIEDIARRLALDGFVALAPDALAPLGGYPGDEDQARELFAKLDPDKAREDVMAGARFLRARPEVQGPVGVVGFCWGGGLANVLATRLPPSELGAVVAFYGMAPPTPSVAAIRVPVLLHYAEHDDRINASRATYEAALKEARVRYEAHDYQGTQHGFNNDTTPRFDAAAAKLAWARTIAFFKRELP